MSEKLVIIDGYSLANRAFFALPQLSTSSGQPTNAVYGLAMMLFKFLEESKPDYIMTAFDVAAPTFRHREYDAYKGQRRKMEDALKIQFPLIRQLLAILRIPIYEQEGFEADDLIGTFAMKASVQELQVEIITGDRDSFQLVGPNVTVLYTRKGITEVDRVTESYIQERYQLIPEQLIDLKGLMGDASDNIPGIPGFGEKTALKYLHQFHSIDQIYENLGEITKARDRQLLTDYRDQAYLSRHLALIRKDVPLQLELHECCRYRDFDKTELLEFCKEYEFKSLVKKLAGAETAEEAHTAIAELPFSIKTIDDGELDQIVSEMKDTKFCALQFFTSTANWFNVKWLGLGLATKEHSWFYPLKNNRLLPDPLRQILADGSIVKCGHDLKRQLLIANKKDLVINGILDDTLIAGYLVNAGIGGLELEDLSLAYLKQTIPVWSNDRGAKFSVFDLPDTLPDNVLEKLAGGRLESIKKLQMLFDSLLEENDLKKLYQEVERPLIQILFMMEQEGIKLNQEVLRDFGTDLGARQVILEREIFDLAGEQFNINSPKQLGGVLFEKLGFKPPKKTKTGYSTDAAVLEGLVNDHPIISKIMAFRQNQKLQSTYIDSLIGLVNPETGRVHTSFNQAVTTTGRLSSTEPNLQNIPIRSDDGKMIRRAFIPVDDDYRLLAADYSQIELRVMAHFSKDPAFMEAFLHEKDIHRHTAAAVHGVSPEEVTKEMRDQAKAVNFGIIYGISGFGLAKNIGVSRKEADAFIKAYFEKYPGVKNYVEQLIEDARKTGEARTLLGRIRKLPDLHARNFTLRSFAERMARNTPIQGTAADIIKVAMVKIGERLKENPEKGKLLLQVHDELIFEVAESQWQALAKMVKQEMEEAILLDVPLEVEFKMGSDWGSMIPVSQEDFRE